MVICHTGEGLLSQGHLRRPGCSTRSTGPGSPGLEAAASPKQAGGFTKGQEIDGITQVCKALLLPPASPSPLLDGQGRGAGTRGANGASNGVTWGEHQYYVPSYRQGNKLSRVESLAPETQSPASLVVLLILDIAIYSVCSRLSFQECLNSEQLGR